MTRRQKAEQTRTEAPPVTHPRRRPTWVLLPAAGVVAAILAGVLIWQTGSDSERTSSGVPASDPGPVHVHGLGIDPADGALFIATHTGLFRVDKSERQASRVTDRRQDTMGFTIVGPHRFLGSGHPDVREAREQGLPPLLGLIESTDAGESWRPISLRGEADFHVLRFAGERVYGYDATNDRLLVSTDRGRTWRRSRSPVRSSTPHPTRATAGGWSRPRSAGSSRASTSHVTRVRAGADSPDQSAYSPGLPRPACMSSARTGAFCAASTAAAGFSTAAASAVDPLRFSPRAQRTCTSLCMTGRSSTRLTAADTGLRARLQHEVKEGLYATRRCGPGGSSGPRYATAPPDIALEGRERRWMAARRIDLTGGAPT